MASLILTFISLLPVRSIRQDGRLAAKVEADSQLNQRLVGSRYRLIERIKQPSYSDYSDLAYVSSGNFGRVYRAIDTSTGSVVAIKVLKESNDLQQIEDERVGCEAQKKARDMAEKLGYPKDRILECVTHNLNVDTLSSGGEAFLVYEWAAGEDLNMLQPDVITKHKETIFRQLLEAVHIMSAAGVSHKDLKPANIKVAVSGKAVAVKVLDFGMADLGADDSRFNLFRYPWAPPEATLEYDHKRDLEVCPELPSWDLWSIAVIYYGLDTMAPPAVGDINRYKCKRYGTELAKVIAAHNLSTLSQALDDACSGYMHSVHSGIKLPAEFWIESCFLEARDHSAIQEHRKMIAEILLMPPCARPSVEEFLAKFKSADEGEPSTVRQGNEVGQPGRATAAAIKKADQEAAAICKNGCGATSVESGDYVFPMGQGKRISYKPSPLDCMGHCYPLAEGTPCAKTDIKVSKIRIPDPPHIMKLCCQVWQNFDGCYTH